MAVRPATAADLSLIMRLERQSQTAAHWSHSHYQSLFAEQAAVRLILVADEAGFLVARQIDREWELENILVADSSRRRGLALQLMGAFLDIARGRNAEFVFLEVRESNVAARGLYEKLGFLPSGRRATYYHNPDEDALTYRLVL